MRPKLMLLPSRPMYLGAGAALLTISGGVVALAAGQADAQSAIQINVTPARSAFAGKISVRGVDASAGAGPLLKLQFLAGGTNAWRTVNSTHTARSGAFRFSLTARESGLLRVLEPGSQAAVPAVSSAASVGGTTPSAPASPSGASDSRSLSVAAKLTVRSHPGSVPARHQVRVNGRLLPAFPARRVILMVRSHGGWRAVSAARTSRNGRYSLPVPADRAGGRRLRVAFAGDHLNRAASADAGSVSFQAPLRPSLASWYDDAGATACGFHAQFGVAHKTLPCGTRVSFRYGSRSVTAVVDDRGPFVGGREWDLNQNTAGALGFGGVDTVFSSI